MKITNKVITYRLKATDEKGQLQLIDDAADLQLPSIEKMTDTIKGAGILGEIDMPTFGQLGSMAFTVNTRADSGKYAMLSRPGTIEFEVVWVTDVFDSATGKVGQQVNKAFLTGLSKKYDQGKVDVGAAGEGTSEFEILTYRRIIDGKEVLLIDKLNYKYVVNGKDYMEGIRAALG